MNNVDKSQLEPPRLVEYLGFDFHSTPKPWVRVTARSKICYLLRRLREQGAGARFQGFTLASVLGLLQSYKLAVSPVRIFTRELYACMNQLPSTPVRWKNIYA
jgi:hypothetical protein